MKPKQAERERIMLILFLQVMFIISIVTFGWFFFFGKVSINGVKTNKITHALYGALWFMFIVDLILFIPIGIIVIAIK